MDRLERATKLREAEKLLLQAADIMDCALRMSGIEQRSGDDSNIIRHIASDPGYGGSLMNLSRDLETLEEDPLWTQPLTSPKKQFGDKGF